MNKKGYAVICIKCISTNIQYDFRNTTISTKDDKASTPVKCLNCGFETVETN